MNKLIENKWFHFACAIVVLTLGIINIHLAFVGRDNILTAGINLLVGLFCEYVSMRGFAIFAYISRRE